MGLAVGASAVIANGQTTSGAVDHRGYSAGGFSIPSAFTGASVSFLACDTIDGTYQALYTTANALVSIPVAASRSYPLPAELDGWAFFKIVSASSEAADRTIRLTLKDR